ncbi:glycosyl hydrolase family 10 [Niveomyces insectorum RCEF 264]|uniref:Beta-xylanase n=1 Tax=Niveomyces insectorum RCEF 264 TaxID=1081102 RepID=A0A167XZH7_9HYPO|nr:glycosyl hydrolase family 10 [Niveomyces insectorum RCEF 264]
MGRPASFFLSGLLASAYSSLVFAQSYGSSSSSSSSGSSSGNGSSSVSGTGSGSSGSSAVAGAPQASSTASTINVNAIGLHSLALANGKLFFGTATDTNLFNDTAYMQIINDRNEFGLLVPENSQKWQPTEPTQDDFVFNNPDSVHSLTINNQQMFRCHTLTWFQQLPNFVTTTAWTREALTAAIQTHIANVVGHFKGRCYSWDVVNEALNDNGTFRNSVFFQTLGTDYIPISFFAAAAADPQARLYYNDFSLEFNDNKTAGALAIVNIVRQAGARIDGLGFQGHMTTGQTPSRQALAAVFNRFTALSLEVAITELDVRQPSLPPSAALVQQQATDYVSMVGACLDVARCVGIVAWEYTDRYSWIPSTFPGTGAACLFDENLAPKPAYTAVVSALAARATGLPAGATIAGIGAAGAGPGLGAFNGGSSAGSSAGSSTGNGNGGANGSANGNSNNNSNNNNNNGNNSNSNDGNGQEFIGNFGGTVGSIPETEVGSAGTNNGGSTDAGGTTTTDSNSMDMSGTYADSYV